MAGLWCWCVLICCIARCWISADNVRLSSITCILLYCRPANCLCTNQPIQIQQSSTVAMLTTLQVPRPSTPNTYRQRTNIDIRIIIIIIKIVVFSWHRRSAHLPVLGHWARRYRGLYHKVCECGHFSSHSVRASPTVWPVTINPLDCNGVKYFALQLESGQCHLGLTYIF